MTPLGNNYEGLLGLTQMVSIEDKSIDKISFIHSFNWFNNSFKKYSNAIIIILKYCYDIIYDIVWESRGRFANQKEHRGIPLSKEPKEGNRRVLRPIQNVEMGGKAISMVKAAKAMKRLPKVVRIRRTSLQDRWMFIRGVRWIRCAGSMKEYSNKYILW